MVNVDNFILDILSLDMESFTLIEESLNEPTEKTFIKLNNNEKFSKDEIIASLDRLLAQDYIKRIEMEMSGLEPDDSEWYSITEKGTDYLNNLLNNN